MQMDTSLGCASTKKKYSFGFLLLLVLIIPAFSQEGFRLVLSGGPQMTAFTGHDFRSISPRDIAVSRDMTAGFQFGFDFEYYFTERFGLAIGLIFSRHGQVFLLEFEPDQGSRILDVRLMSAKIPFALLSRLLLTSKTNLFLKAGVYAAYRTDAEDNYQDVIPEEIGLPPAEDRYSSNDFGWLVGLGAELSLSRMLNLRVAAGIDGGLRNVFSTEPWGYMAGAAEAKNTTISLSIGLVYLDPAAENS